MFTTAAKTYNACAEFRKKRRRFIRFTYGRQWDDTVVDPKSGRIMSEADIVRRNGTTPLTNNLIRQMVKTVIGRFRTLSSVSVSGESSSGLPAPSGFLSETSRRNRLPDLDARNLEEFLISGIAVQKISLRRGEDGKPEPFIENVNPSKFFIGNVGDPRGFDVDLIGMLHDLTPGQLLSRFAGTDPAAAAELKEIYSDVFRPGISRSIPLPFTPAADSFTEAPEGMCRVVEVWNLENRELLRVLDDEIGEYSEHPAESLPEIEKENSLRAESGRPPLKVRYECRSGWTRRCYSFDGKLLSCDKSPFPDGGHPFCFRLYPLIDGEVHPFVEDIIDQQRCINRMITLIDNIMAASAKGLLLYPVNLKPDNLSWATIAERWTNIGGIIPYIARPGLPAPQQVTAAGLDAGASNLLDIQMNMMKNISGVTDTLMGKASSPSSGIERYEAELRNATIALTDILDTYSGFINDRNERLESLRSEEC